MVSASPCVVNRPGGVATRQRFEEVVRELGEVRLRVSRVDALEDLAGPQVRRPAAACAERLVQSVTDEPVPEPKPTDRRGLSENPGLDGLVEDVEHRILVEFDNGG